MRLILASASPRRAELLTSAGFTFQVAPADVDETPHAGEVPDRYAFRIAKRKAEAAAKANPDPASVVLAADTVVAAAGRILGKPKDNAEAEWMLRQLSGMEHQVHTAVVVRWEGGERSEIATTHVRFGLLTDTEIEWYIATGEPQGKAGAYAIQGYAARFVEWIEGSWSNVVGLPISTVYRLLKQAGDVD